MSVRTLPGNPVPIAGNGDVNGDGLSDVVIAGPLENESRGCLMVFYGSTNGLHTQPDWVEQGERPNQRLGLSVAMLDVNGDGLSDVVATQWPVDPAVQEDRWRVLVFLGSTNGLPASPSQLLPATVGHFRLNWLLASAGDVNGDRSGDLAIAASDDSQPPEHQDAVLIFEGSPVGLSISPAWVTHSEQRESYFGHDIAAAGDVNHDGYGDFLVGAMKYSGKYYAGGKAYMFLGSTNGLQPEPSWTSEYPFPLDPQVDGGKNQFFSCGLGPAGDVNGDGFDDVLIGAWFAGHGDVEEGVAFLFYGSKLGLASRPAWFAEGNHPHVHLGRSVAAVGDLDDDGFADVAVGVPFASDGRKDEGAVLVYHGSSRGLAREPASAYDGERSGGHLGEFVSSAGDVNGDGTPDLLLAGADTAETTEPMLRVALVYGRRGDNKPFAGWSPEKPLLAALEQNLERLPRRSLWLAMFVALGVVVAGLLLAQRRLRRRLAAVIEQNRQLAAVEERTRIARDIHDHLGADLTQLAAQLDRAASLAQSPHAATPGQLPHLQRSAQKAVKTLDELVWATDPRQDSLEGLANYLVEFAPVFAEAHGHACDLDLPASLPPGQVSSLARHNLFLIAKEALRNAVQHAGATRVRVSLAVNDGRIELSVEDNGRGMPRSAFADRSGRVTPAIASPTAKAKPGHGNGLANMTARAAELGGLLSVTGVVPQGTRVSVSVSMDKTPNSMRKDA